MSRKACLIVVLCLSVCSIAVAAVIQSVSVTNVREAILNLPQSTSTLTATLSKPGVTADGESSGMSSTPPGGTGPFVVWAKVAGSDVFPVNTVNNTGWSEQWTTSGPYGVGPDGKTHVRLVLPRDSQTLDAAVVEESP